MDWSRDWRVHAVHGLVLGLSLSLMGCVGGDPDLTMARLGSHPAISLPFADEPGTATRTLLARIATGAMIALPEVTGLPPALDLELREGLAKAAEAREIAVLLGMRPGGETLEGRAHLKDADGARRIAIDWTLYGPDGSEASSFTAETPWASQPVVEANALTAAGRELALHLAEASAIELRRTLDRRSGVLPDDILGPLGPAVKIALLGITGAPGDGAERLASALAGVLRGRGFEVVPRRALEEAAFHITVTVRIVPGDAGSETVALDWRVSDAAGRHLGTVSQANAVPAGLLDAGWGDVALLAAMGAAEGLVPLLSGTLVEGPAPTRAAAVEPKPPKAASAPTKVPDSPRPGGRPPPELLKLRPALDAP